MFTENLLMQFPLTLTIFFLSKCFYLEMIYQNITATAQRNSADFLTAYVKILLLIQRATKNINNKQLHHRRKV